MQSWVSSVHFTFTACSSWRSFYWRCFWVLEPCSETWDQVKASCSPAKLAWLWCGQVFVFPTMCRCNLGIQTRAWIFLPFSTLMLLCLFSESVSLGHWMSLSTLGGLEAMKILLPSPTTVIACFTLTSVNFLLIQLCCSFCRAGESFFRLWYETNMTAS